MGKYHFEAFYFTQKLEETESGRTHQGHKYCAAGEGNFQLLCIFFHM
jgi:hypothetical protein